MKTRWRKVILTAVLVAACGEAGAATYYVDASRPDDGGYGTNWATAKKTIQAAVDMAVDGDTVLVTNGVYAVGERVTPGYASSNRVVITKNIVVRSVNGPAVTIIQGRGPIGSNAVRCVYMSAGMLRGFTLTNGFTWKKHHPNYLEPDACGGGVNMYGGNAFVRDCIISGNSAASLGGGVFRGTVNRSTIIGNRAEMGGGMSDGTVNESVIISNSAGTGGGAFWGTVNNCTISGNQATHGGGAYYCTVNQCVVSGNRASQGGGGTYLCTVNNSVISSNVAWGGGGAHGGTLNNCLIVNNDGRLQGGGMLDSTVSNCTIVSNYANDGDGRGGGVNGGLVVNSIVWGNSGKMSNNHFNTRLVHSCTTPLQRIETGNITNHPQFLNATGGNYRLADTSPCINAGTNDSGMAWQTDLDGNPRILPVGGVVDMGCYEHVPEPLGAMIGLMTVCFSSGGIRRGT